MADFANDLAAVFFNSNEELEVIEEHEDDRQNDETVPEPTAKKPRSLRRGLVKAAGIQDMLLEKLLHQMIPVDEVPPGQPQVQLPENGTDGFERPGFTVGAMSNNFRRFNARIGVVFKFQARVLRLFMWRRPSHTLSFLAVYTFVCLDPYLLCVIPLVVALFAILVPSFVARHPAPISEPDRVRNLGYSPRGPPLAPARTVKPVKELSRDFFRNMGDLQNVMEDFSVAHDKVIALVVPKTNFSDEALSSAIFALLSAAAVLMSIAAHLIPWRFIALIGGWAAIWSCHPAVSALIQQTHAQYLSDANPKATAAQNAFDSWVRSDIILDEAPETREVEIFELQRLSGGSSPSTLGGTGEWEPWLFSPSPYDPLSAQRIAGQRPLGARFFEDVKPPEGWEWSEKKWALDLWSREWVEERIITGVEVETEGERWVYDIYNEHEQQRQQAAQDPSAVVDSGATSPGRTGYSRQVTGTTVSWEEGEEGMGRRGEWRRRRWVRLVKRKGVTGA